MITPEQQTVLDAQIAQAEQTTGRKLTQAEIDQIYADVQKMINNLKKEIDTWADDVGDNIKSEVTGLVKSVENIFTAADFTNPNNPAAIYAEGKEPVWIYLKKKYEEWEKNGQQVTPTDETPPTTDFCISNFVQVAVGIALPIGASFLSNLKANICAPDGGIVDAIDSIFPGFKEGYQQAADWRKDKLNEGLDMLNDFTLERQKIFAEITKWKNWDTLISQEIAKFQKLAKDEVQKFVQDKLQLDKTPGLTPEQVIANSRTEAQIGAALAKIAVDGLERCYNNNPMFKDIKKVVEDTRDVIKIYTDGLYEQLSGLNTKIASIEQDLGEILVDIRDYDPCSMVEDVVGKGEDCYSCYSNYLKWKVDDTRKLKQPVCSINWCVATDSNGNRIPDWLNTPSKAK